MEGFFHKACDKANTDEEKKELCHRLVDDFGEEIISELSVGTPDNKV